MVTGREFALADETIQSSFTQFNPPVVTSSFTGRRSLFVEFPYRAEFPLTADFDFLARVAEHTRFGHVPEVLLRYRRYPSQAAEEHAADIERDRCRIRLLTYRRRAGLEEDMATLSDPSSVRYGEALPTSDAPPPSVSCFSVGQRCVAEKFYVLAAFHARRSLSLDRSLGNAWRCWRLGMRAISGARGRERLQARRMFFSGPERALGIKVDNGQSS